MKKRFLFISMIICLSGCATIPTANPKGVTLIESDPPGARIEINNQYVGTTPLRVDIPRIDPNTWSNTFVIIVANPTQAGQQVQKKIISSDQPTPTHIFFDMNLVNVPQSINVNVDKSGN